MFIPLAEVTRKRNKLSVISFIFWGKMLVAERWQGNLDQQPAPSLFPPKFKRTYWVRATNWGVDITVTKNYLIKKTGLACCRAGILSPPFPYLTKYINYSLKHIGTHLALNYTVNSAHGGGTPPKLAGNPRHGRKLFT